MPYCPDPVDRGWQTPIPKLFMTKHDIVMGICGAIALIILAAACGLTLGGTAQMRGELLAMNVFPGSEIARARNHKAEAPAQDILPTYPTVKQASSSSAAVIAVVPSACDAATRVSADLDAVLKKTLPLMPEYAKARAAIKKVQKDSFALYCGHASPSDDSDVTGSVDNHCEQFIQSALRHTQCIIMEKLGQEYRGY